MQYLIYPIAIYVLLIIIRYLILFLLLYKSQIQYPKYQTTKGDTVPIYLKDLFQTPIKELKQFGFLPCSYLQYQPITKVYEQTNWELLLYNKALKSYATAVIRRLNVIVCDVDSYEYP